MVWNFTKNILMSMYAVKMMKTKLFNIIMNMIVLGIIAFEIDLISYHLISISKPNTYTNI